MLGEHDVQHANNSCLGALNFVYAITGISVRANAHEIRRPGREGGLCQFLRRFFMHASDTIALVCGGRKASGLYSVCSG